MSTSGWIGVDLDGTLARYDGWIGVDHIGEPVPRMLARVKAWLAEGVEVRIFTARCFPLSFVRADDDMNLFVGANDAESGAGHAAIHIHEWLDRHLGQRLAITCRKDFAMMTLYDDRVVQVEMNTGRLIGSSHVIGVTVA